MDAGSRLSDVDVGICNQELTSNKEDLARPVKDEANKRGQGDAGFGIIKLDFETLESRSLRSTITEE